MTYVELKFHDNKKTANSDSRKQITRNSLQKILPNYNY